MGWLAAIDPETGKQIWSVKTAEDDYQSITGAAYGRFLANLGPGMATPVTYMLDGEQYVSILAGRNGGRLFTFVLDGKQPIPAPPRAPARGGNKQQ